MPGVSSTHGCRLHRCAAWERAPGGAPSPGVNDSSQVIWLQELPTSREIPGSQARGRGGWLFVPLSGQGSAPMGALSPSWSTGGDVSASSPCWVVPGAMNIQTFGPLVALGHTTSPWQSWAPMSPSFPVTALVLQLPQALGFHRAGLSDEYRLPGPGQHRVRLAVWGCRRI